MDILSFENLMRTIAKWIDTALKGNPGPKGFALIVFDFNSPGAGNYISNADRKDMIATLRETADRLEQNQDIPAAHTTIQ